MSQPGSEWITTQDAADLVGRCRPTIYGWIKRGWLTRHKVLDEYPKLRGRKYRLMVSRAEVLAVAERIGPRKMQGPRIMVEVPMAAVHYDFEEFGKPLSPDGAGVTEYMRWKADRWAAVYWRELPDGRIAVDASEAFV